MSSRGFTVPTKFYYVHYVSLRFIVPTVMQPAISISSTHYCAHWIYCVHWIYSAHDYLLAVPTGFILPTGFIVPATIVPTTIY